MGAPTPIVDAGDGTVLAVHVPDFLSAVETSSLHEAMVSRRADFKSGFMLRGDLWVKTPRLVAEYGDGTFVFPDTGPNLPWPSEVMAVLDRLGTAWGRFNYVLANWYRDGRDFTGWHTDKMDLHEPGTGIAMISTGCHRSFRFRSTDDRRAVATVDVGAGSLLVLLPASQDGYEHAVLPEPEIPGARISLTFRELLPTDRPCTCRSSRTLP